MKSFSFPQCLRLFCPFAILLATSPSARSGESPNTLEVQGLFIYATHEQMKGALDAAGLADPPNAPLSAAQFETVREKVKELGAEFFSHPQGLALSGQKAVINAVREFKYPVKFDKNPREPGRMLPAAFGTRNVGVTLEFTGTVRPDGLIDLLLVSEVTDFLGFIDYLAQKPAGKDGSPALEELLKAPLTSGGAWQPIFASFTIDTKIRLRSEQTLLFGGPVKIEPVAPPKGGSAPRSTTPEKQVFVFITAKSIVAQD